MIKKNKNNTNFSCSKSNSISTSISNSPYSYNQSPNINITNLNLNNSQIILNNSTLDYPHSKPQKKNETKEDLDSSKENNLSIKFITKELQEFMEKKIQDFSNK